MEIWGGGNSEKSPFLLKSIEFDVFAKLFCPALQISGWRHRPEESVGNYSVSGIIWITQYQGLLLSTRDYFLVFYDIVSQLL